MDLRDISTQKGQVAWQAAGIGGGQSWGCWNTMNSLYKEIKEDQVTGGGACDSDYMIHCVEKNECKRKQRRESGSQLWNLTLSDDLR
jgi:hypothetical protein